MLTRKSFLRRSGALAMGTLVMRDKLFAGAAVKPVGLQLYTLFNVIDSDVPGTLKKIHDIGYSEVESAFSRKGAYYGMSPKDFSKMTKDVGLAWVSHHVLGAPFKMPPPAPGDTTRRAFGQMPPMKNLKENYQALVDDASEGGLQYLVCAGIPLSNTAEIKEAVDILSKTGAACKKAGITFAYHNHTHEFENVEGQVPYDALLAIDADLLKMELDVAWATKANADPVGLFKKNPGRFPLLHVKDIDKASGNPVEVGNGYVDFKSIFANTSTGGVKHYFVEQDGAKEPFENIATSYRNVTKLLA